MTGMIHDRHLHRCSSRFQFIVQNLRLFERRHFVAVTVQDQDGGSSGLM